MYIITISAPLISFIIAATHTKKIKSRTIQNSTCLILFFSWINSSIILYECIISHTHCQTKLWNWIETEYLTCKISLHTDLLSSSMLFTVTLISFFIHAYSTEYMKNDPHTLRFMSYLSLFTFFMLILTNSNNYIFLLIGWEGVGICSYLLINFWYTRTQANKSGAKAIIINRIGDIALLISTLLIIKKFGSSKFETLTHTHANDNHTQINIICFLLLLGAIGKSSLIGLHVWLPDAMEGPTPVSALIHAATMVTAGIFILIRSSSLLEESKISLTLTAWIGVITAFFAASIGSTQNDIKRIIAYSTCSQLGYMALAIGISKYSISLLHLINHAFFKSLLFLSAGIAIHTISNEQDIRKLSNMATHTPIIYTSLLIGSLTITGIPFLTAHFSKEQIIENAYKNSILYTLAIITATLTAFYSTRLLYFVFIKQPQYLIKKKSLDKSEENILTNIVLTLLISSSIIIGYITFTIITNHLQHPIIPKNLKTLPILLSIITSLILIILHQKKHIITNIINNNIIFKNFLSNAWNFNTLYNNIITEKAMHTAHTQSYKNTDKGLIETTINNNIIQYIKTYSNKISKDNPPKYLNTSQH
uniref:NADH-ubiquinone oxidoreductase chain 5 n=1 Tax=Hertwigia falcifera TaxID=1183871 RepID=A0A0N7ALE9_HERFA|nr:NADH dehydrogenase subunit 5 [Hertwigia falcifera]